jgi:DNA-binding CsgD family transcriptional regulator
VHDIGADKKLRRLIASCTRDSPTVGSPGGSLRVPNGAGRTALRMLVAPCPGQTSEKEMNWFAPAGRTAMLLVTDPERRWHTRRSELQRRFGLTPAETELALNIIKGDGRAAAASRLGITVSTARTHLTHIFEKTGVRRQAELVRFLLQNQEETQGRCGIDGPLSFHLQPELSTSAVSEDLFLHGGRTDFYPG